MLAQMPQTFENAGKFCHSDSEGRWFESSLAYFPQCLVLQGVAGFLYLSEHHEFLTILLKMTVFSTNQSIFGGCKRPQSLDSAGFARGVTVQQYLVAKYRDSNS